MATALPSFATVNHNERCTIIVPPKIQEGDVTGVTTLSGNGNVTCDYNTPGSNEGGSGGGGATVSNSRICGVAGECVEGHKVLTTSGNAVYNAHYNPNQQQ